MSQKSSCSARPSGPVHQKDLIGLAMHPQIQRVDCPRSSCLKIFKAWQSSFSLLIGRYITTALVASLRLSAKIVPSHVGSVDQPSQPKIRHKRGWTEGRVQSRRTIFCRILIPTSARSSKRAGPSPFFRMIQLTLLPFFTDW